MFRIGSSARGQEAGLTADSIWQHEFHATRTSAHVAFALIVWPVVTLAGTAAAVLLLPYYSVSFRDAIFLAALGMALSVPDMLVVGGLVFGLSALTFGHLGLDTSGRKFGYLRLGLEPLVTFLAVVAGASLWYPAMLSAPLLTPVGRMPVGSLIAMLMCVSAVGAAWAARPGKRGQLVAVVLIGGISSPLPARLSAQIVRWTGHPPAAVVLGIDSVSHADDVRPLEEWTAARSGAWYEHAVAPGLLTNAVWSSILAMEPIRTHRVFLTFQRLPSDAASLLTSARAKGYRTVGAFSDQLTCMVGSRAGFDEDRSGPVGWRQLILPLVANNSFLLPVFKPALPRMPFMAMSPNQAGTFSYDVRREVREVLRSGSRAGPSLVMAHLTYPHLPAYPSSADLTWEEMRRVARAPAETVFDRSFDWQDADAETDPLQLHRWKIAHLQNVIASEVDQSRYVEHGGKLIVFSDHGDRANLKIRTFGEPRYHHVLLATFGMPARCTRAPISLADIGSLLQLADRVTEPAVEYMFTPETLVPVLVKHAKLRWSGDVDIDGALLDRLFKELLRHDPWQEIGQRACH